MMHAGRMKAALCATPGCCLAAVLLAGCAATQPRAQVDHVQGEMAGEVTTTSAILQSRLTAAAVAVDGDLPGAAGIARFEIARNPEFEEPQRTRWVAAEPGYDFIVKTKVDGLAPGTLYYYRLLFGPDERGIRSGPTRTFRTLPPEDVAAPVAFVVVTGMNYYFFHHGDYVPDHAYKGEDKHLGYPALEAIARLKPDFFIGTGDNVYFDHPGTRNFQRAVAAGKNPQPSAHRGEQVETEAGMRHKYHEQFLQPRFVQLFSSTPTYWEKDDHDYRCNDSWPSMKFPISHELGVRNFKEQLPVVDPLDPDAVTYRTYRVGTLLQLWFVEGRDYRSANTDDDGPGKTIWGAEQKEWLKRTLAGSTATFKLLISPTPLVGPDDKGKRDNHTNLNGFRYEGEEFFRWAKETKLDRQGFYIVCGDRHWQYHSIHPSGFEEFSCGALVEANSRMGVPPGDKQGTDPDARIRQPYTSREPSAGFLRVSVQPPKAGAPATLTFTYYDERGAVLHEVQKQQK